MREGSYINIRLVLETVFIPKQLVYLTSKIQITLKIRKKYKMTHMYEKLFQLTD